MFASKVSFPLPLKFRCWGAAALVFLAPALLKADSMEAFEELRNQIQQQGHRATSPSEVLRLVELGDELGVPFQAQYVLSRYLSAGGETSPELLLASARNAVLTGEYLVGVARYKSFLAEGVGEGTAAAEAAVELYRLLIDVVQDPQDAFATILEEGGRFSGDERLVKFDRWALLRAMDENRPAAAVVLLHRILGRELPLEQERVFVWSPKDELLQAVSRAPEALFEGQARDAVAGIADRIRDDHARAGLWRVAAANLEYLSAEQSGERESRRLNLLEETLRQAERAVEAHPEANQLVEVLYFLMGGHGRTHRSAWETFAEERQEFFVEAFGKLSRNEKTAFLQWLRENASAANFLAEPDQWSALLLDDAEAFREAGPLALAEIPFGPMNFDRGSIRRLGEALEGVSSVEAAVLRSLAREDDLREAVVVLVRRESAALDPRETSRYLRDTLIPAYIESRSEGDESFADQVIFAYGKEAYGKTIAGHFDNDGVNQFLRSAWDLGGDYDRSEAREALESLRWISFIGNNQERDAISRSNVPRNVGRWGNSLRRDAGDGDEQAEAALSQVTELEDLLREITEADPDENWEQGPDSFNRQFARARVAAERGNDEDFLRDFRSLMSEVRGYGEDPLPFQRGAFQNLVRAISGNDMLEAQVEFFGDLLSDYRGDRADFRMPALKFLADAMQNNAGWRSSWDRIGEDDREISLRVNDHLAEALVREMEEGRFSSQVFDWFRRTRNGHRWSDREHNVEVFTKMIETRILFEADFRWDEHRGATGTYMNLVHNDFRPLRETYPPETWFDDWMAEEIRETGWIDRVYNIRDGEDEEGKIAAAVLEVLQGWEYLPLGYRGEETVYTLSDVENRHRFLRDFAGPRQLAQLDERLRGWAGDSRFDADALGAFWFEFLPIDTTRPPGRESALERYADFLDLARRSPERLGPPRLDWLEEAGTPSLRLPPLSRDQIDLLIRTYEDASPADWRSVSGREWLPITILRHLEEEEEDWPMIISLLPSIWRMQLDSRRADLEEWLMKLADRAMDREQYELATAISTHALEMVGDRLSSDAAGHFGAIRSQAVVQIGGMIPVESGDPRYPMFEAQVSYLSGSRGNAWRTYLDNRDILMPMLQELNPTFVIWLIEEHTRREQFGEAEALVQEMLPWMDEVRDSVSPEVRGRLFLAQAAISFADQEYPTARAQYMRVVNASEFDGTRAQEDARLMVAEVDRVTRQFDQAIDQLERLTRRGSHYQRTQAHYQLATVYFDQDEYTQAGRELQKVFTREPNHHQALILQGEINIKARRLQEATDIPIGLETAQTLVVPGRPLRIHLEDANLAVVGAEEAIEIRIWTTSGDEETVNLFPAGESRTRFEVQVPTELGPVRPGDGTLQIFGNDEIRYDYSDAFRERRNLEEGDPPVLRVASNAELMVSSGEILSREEMAQRRLEQMVRERAGQREDAEVIARSEVRQRNQIKPGNPVNVRVVDFDRSISADRDELTINAATTSGDRVSNFALLETGPHTGIFEGSIPTASAPATAFATNSDEGRVPNQVISSGEHSAWMARRDNVRPKVFGVDLNDNRVLQELVIEAREPGRKLRDFRVDVSLNNRDFQTVGSWPEAMEGWDGSPRVHLARLGDNVRIRNAGDIQRYLDRGYLEAGRDKTVFLFEGFPDSLGDWIDENRGVADLGRDNRDYVAHVELAFQVPVRQTRTLRFTPSENEDVTTYFQVNGTNVSQEGEYFETTQAFSQGVHRIDVFIKGQRRYDPDFTIEWNIEEPPYFEPIPADHFDPEVYPGIENEVGYRAAEIVADEAGETFTVSFGDDTRARVVRLLLTDFEGDAPAINQMRLEDVQGEQILPVGRDLTRLHEEDQLYIIPGDRLTVTYTDPVTLSEERTVHEAFLNATYHNATIRAAFSRYDERGEERLIPMRRYHPGDAVNIVISDPDADVSSERDRVTFTARNAMGQSIEIEAMETGEHTGVFIGRIFPVPGEPTRDGEIQVREGDDLLVSYLDETNTDPGIPWNRTAVIEQAFYIDPELRMYAFESFEDIPEGGIPERPTLEDQLGEYFPAERSIVAERPQPASSEGISQMLGAPILAEVLFPTIALSTASRAEIFVQTQRGREAFVENGGTLPEEGMALEVPGTIRLESATTGASRFDPPKGYRSVIVRGDPNALSPIDDGRFTFSIPTELGSLPRTSPALEEKENPDRPLPEGARTLRVTGGDRVFVGFQYEDEEGNTQWLQAEADLVADPFFAVMDRRYRGLVDSAHVGERVHLRVLDLARSVGEENRVEISVSVDGRDHQQTIYLSEELPHTGIYKGTLTLAHQDDRSNREGENVLPLRYGESFRLSYTGQNGATVEQSVSTHKGADGRVMPFTKRFTDSERAVQTHFMQAEAHFELAKRQRELDQESLARRHIQQGQRLLDEAMRDFPDTENQAQAQYLLANLSMEFAEMAVNEEMKERHFLEALSRFTDIVSLYPDSTYAPQAQYKRAQVFEKMGEIDRASEEYVRLSYRFPDNELVAETIARLGQYFMTVGRNFNEEADEAEAADDLVKAESIRQQAKEMFETAGDVFGRLAERFPDHHLAGRTTVLAGTSYLRSGQYERAAKVLLGVVDDGNQEPSVRAEAAYWAADAYARDNKMEDAFRMFTRLTWDFPETRWARFARGRLTEPQFSRMDN
ncbi:MAG: tetratricopeptide repeat protein [Opitutales bacterium]|nr:tetratricopeptide repeat protein [Opitutales bacterium]MCH8539836.1 tetratricopeptide repeat protein [Opitutales bacterium]